MHSGEHQCNDARYEERRLRPNDTVVVYPIVVAVVPVDAVHVPDEGDEEDDPHEEDEEDDPAEKAAETGDLKPPAMSNVLPMTAHPG